MENASSDNIVTDLFDSYTDTQKEVLQIKLRKTKKILLWLAVILLIGDLLSLIVANGITATVFFYSLVYPALFVGLAFLALKEPVIAMIAAAVLFLLVWGYMIYVNGIIGLFTGWLGKAIVIYLLIAGFQSAVAANSIRKELKG